jgi:hypothetical protein
MNTRRWRRVAIAHGVCAAAALCLALPAHAQTKQTLSGGIYSCVTAEGRRLTSDRPIPECLSRGQTVLNRDGSVRGAVPPSLTAEERAAKDEQESRDQSVQTTRQDAVRRDRNLKQRFPNEAAHNRMREAALESQRIAIKNIEKRLDELIAERKPLFDELEFYVGRTVPANLRQQIDANDAANDALRSTLLNQRAELDRVTRLYDLELAHLRKLWAGAELGSEPMPTETPNAGPVTPVQKVKK